MNGPDEPDWLSSEGPLPSEVLAAMRAADHEDGTAAQIARLEAQLAPLWSLPPSVPEGSAASGEIGPVAHGGASLSGIKLMTAALVVIGAGALMWPQRELAQRHVEARGSARAPSVASDPAGARDQNVSVQAPESAMLLVAPTPRAEAIVAAAPAVVPEAETRAPAVRTRPTAELDARASTGTLAVEARLLKSARHALAAQPEEALRLTDRHRLRFPKGVLAEEREAIAIKALRSLGHEQAAAVRQARFVQHFPESPHLTSLNAPAGTVEH